MEEVEKKLREICTYYSEFGEGTAGYSLSEEQFAKIMSLISQEKKEVARDIIDRVTFMIDNRIPPGERYDILQTQLEELRAKYGIK